MRADLGPPLLLSLLPGAMVTAADIGDCAATRALLARVADAHHRLVLIWATAAIPAASSSTAWPRAPWVWRSSSAATVRRASW